MSHPEHAGPGLEAPPPRPLSARQKAPRPPTNWFIRQRMSGDGVVPVAARARALAQVREASGLVGEGADAAVGTWVEAGPYNIGGRVTALGVDPGNANVIWLGAADGGIWKSTDGGVNWSPRFDAQTALSIGALAVHPTNGNIVYVGTGEENGGGYSYDGEGVFKTTDGGLTWTSLGLAETRRIGGIAIDPSNPQRIFVAAGGGVFNQDEHRGVYRSTDGGASWQKVLFVANTAGAIDVAIDPGNPSRVYAAIWERYAVDDEIVFGGTHSGIWQSTNGGTTWTLLTNGLPASSPTIGRIGLAIAKSSPSTVYALYHDHPGNFMGLWKTTNSGASWARADNPTGNHRFFLVSYGYYFGEVRVDPTNANIVYVLDSYWFKSTDGGFTLAVKASGIHVDHHDLVILPANRLLMGTDGGFYASDTGGTSWIHATTLPISQTYDIAIDRSQPLRRFMGLQDNGTVRTTTGGLSNWSEVLGGDGLQCEVDPLDGNRVYASSQGGAIARSVDGGTNFFAATNGISGAERTNWNAPLTHDPITSQKLYTGTTRVYRTTNGAGLWNPISPDLTNGPATSMITYDKDAVAKRRSHLADIVRGTVTTIGVSPLDTNIVWAGTDDGNVWVTSDAGGVWTKVNPPGRTEWVTRVVADLFHPQTAYVTYSGFRDGSKEPHLLKTTDRGQSWTPIDGNLPDMPLNCVVSDPDNEGRLFVGTDLGVSMTDDGGVTWSSLQTGMPYTVVHDLYVHEPSRKLYAGTHARGLYTFDLAQLPPPDRDGDGVVNINDCAPDDAGAFTLPGEIANLQLASNKTTISWTSAAAASGSGTVHDVLKGPLSAMPVGTGAESCLAAGLTGATASDPAVPAAGGGYRYLARGRNACGTGTYGAQSNGTPRASSACP